jgi:hypothetical protein
MPCMQTTEEVPGLVLECLHERTIHMRALYHDGQLQDGKLSWSGCDRLWSYGLTEPGHVFNAHSYAAAQQLAQVPVLSDLACDAVNSYSRSSAA